MDQVLLSSKYNDWCTPDWLFEYLDREFHFILDAAADDVNHKCELYYTKEKSGLDHSWNIGGSVFCNPPYGRSIDKWIKKAFNEWSSGCGDIVLLIPARTDTNYFHDYILPYAEICFLRGRISFVDPRNNRSDRAPFPSMIVIYRKKIDLGVDKMNYYDKIKEDRKNRILITLPLMRKCYTCEWYRDIGVGYCIANPYFCDCDNCPYFKERSEEDESAVPRL